MSPMKLLIFKEIDVRLPLRRLHRLFEIVINGEGNPDWPAAVNLVLTDNPSIRQLNNEYRAIDRPTDVLSFNIDPPEDPDGVFGEIYLSVPYVKRQAADNGNGIWAEYLMLFCHGLLHLFGYDHATSAEEASLFRLQAGYLEELKAAG
jgi:probable rRNA maturation factor